MFWLGEWVPNAEPFEYADPVIYEYRKTDVLKDGRIRVTREDGAVMVMCRASWEQAFAAIRTFGYDD